LKENEFYVDKRNDLRGPLEGVRVIELTTTWAGPMCGCMLADMGADVIKVEHPKGDVARSAPPILPGTNPPLSFMQATINRNKRSMAFDVSTEDGRTIFLKLVKTSDIVIENLRPGTLDRWKIGYRDLCKVRKDIVMVSISGYGQYGENSSRPGYDPLAQAESGFLSLSGEPKGTPTKSPTFIGDDLGGLHASISVLGALRHRDQTGEGQHVDVSLLDAMLFQNPYLTLGAMGVPLPRLGNEFRVAAPAKVFTCKDGLVMFGIIVDSHWKILTKVIGQPELATDDRFATNLKRIAQRDTVHSFVDNWTKDQTVEAVVRTLAEAGLPAAPVQTYAEAASSNIVQERRMLQTIQTENNSIPVPGPPAKFSKTPTKVRSGAPALGKHNHELLKELGFTTEVVEELNRKGIVL